MGGGPEGDFFPGGAANNVITVHSLPISDRQWRVRLANTGAVDVSTGAWAVCVVVEGG